MPRPVLNHIVTSEVHVIKFTSYGLDSTFMVFTDKSATLETPLAARHQMTCGVSNRDQQ